MIILRRMNCIALNLAVFMIVGCGGGGGGGASSTGSSGGLTQGQVAAIAQQISVAGAQGLAGVSGLRSAAKATNMRAEQIVPQQTTCNTTGCLINWPINFTSNCTVGGRMNLTGDITGTINLSGSGLIGFQADLTITDWACVEPLIINGDPFVSIVGTFTFLNGAPSSTQEIVVGGGFKWGNGPGDGCQINLTTNFASNGTGNTSGTVCGQAVNESFSY